MPFEKEIWRGNQETCVLTFPEDLAPSAALDPPPQVGFRDSINNPKRWSLTAVTFPDFESEPGRSSALLSSQPWQGHTLLFKAGLRAKATQFAVTEGRALNVGAQPHCIPLKGFVSASKWDPKQFACLFSNLLGLALLGGAGFNSSPSLALSYRSWMTKLGHKCVCPSADKISLGRSAEPQLPDTSGT